MTETIELTVGKANPVCDPVPDAHIHISGPLPPFGTHTDLAKWDAYCDDQARQIETTLHRTLPGGMYDRLAGHMLARMASQE